MAETKKERLMRILEISAEDAQKIIDSDKAIDRGEPQEFDLTPEQEKNAKKYRQADRKVSDKKITRERKENAVKGQIIAEIHQFLCEKCSFSPENVEILNKERQISFTVGDEKFELTLVQKRKAKN
jgi:hypothetical protein